MRRPPSSLANWWKQLGCVAFIFLLFSLGVFVRPTLAHRPHDVVTQVDVSPTYSDDQTVLIIVRGNVYRSTDGGVSWQRIVQGLRTPDALTDLELSQQDDNVALLGTRGDGVYRSTDQGVSWQNSSNGLNDVDVSKIAISPAISAVALATSESGAIYRTEDTGNTWQQVAIGETSIEAIGFSSDGQMAIAITTNQLLISRDRGETWQTQERAVAGLPPDRVVAAVQLTSEGGQPESLWVATQSSGVFQTPDSGSTWNQVAPPIPDESIEDLEILSEAEAEVQIFASTSKTGVFLWDGDTWQPRTEGLQIDGQAQQMEQPNFTDLALSPDGQVSFLAGFDGLFRSNNAGQEWQDLETLARGTIVALAVSNNADGETTLAAVDYVGDVRLSHDGGQTWEIAERGLQIPWFTRNFQPVDPNSDPRRYFDVALSPDYSSDDILWAATLWTKVVRSQNAGQSWSITALPDSQRGLALAASPNFSSDRTVYVATQSGTIYQSQNRGKAFEAISQVPALRGNYGPSIAISPDFARDRTLYVTGEEGIYKSTNAGQDWQAVTASSALADAGKMQIAISPNFAQDQTVFVSTNNQGLFQSQDAGETWTQRNVLSASASEFPYLEAIAISPDYANDQTVLMSIRGEGLYQSDDAGQTFSRLTDASIPLSRLDNVPSSGKPIVFSPNYASDQTVYGFGSARSEIFKSTDGGRTWQILELPTRSDTETALGPGTRFRMLLSFNRGRIVKGLALLIVAAIGYGLVSFIDRLGAPATRQVWTFLIVTVLALGVFFRFANVDQNVYSADEVRKILRLSGYTSAELQDTRFNGELITAQEIREQYQVPTPQKDLSDTLTALASNPEHPPLYFVITRYWMQVFNTPVAARTISIIFGLITLLCLYWLCIELFHAPLVAWIAVLLAAVSPFHIMAAQNASQYSLWLLTTCVSSAVLLRAVYKDTKQSWIAYGLSVALGLYTHLFFVIVALSHGLYILLAWFIRSAKTLLHYLLSSLLGVVLFLPWAVVVLTNLDVIEERTRFYSSFDNNNLGLMSRRFLANLGNIFLDFHNQSRLEAYFDRLLIGVVIYGIYFLIRHTPIRVWLLPVSLAGVTVLSFMVPDLISSSARSLQSRYYVPCFLAIEIIVAYLIAGYIQLVPFKVWRQRIGRLALLGFLSVGVLSGIFITQINDWGLDDQKGTASGKNLAVAPILNASPSPVVISDATHSFILALSHLTKDEVSFQLFQAADQDMWESNLDLDRLSRTFSDIYLYDPDPALIDFVDQTTAFETESISGTDKFLYTVVPKTTSDVG